MILYGDVPFYDSADPIESRHTRKVLVDNEEITKSPEWKRPNVQSPYISSTPNSSIQFSFKGSDIYWRAVRNSGLGKADIYIDNIFQKTVDCWASCEATDMFSFIKTGLDPAASHTIKILVRGDKNPRSSGTAIIPLSFEYSAESYRASYGFSSIQGKNNWRYQQRKGAAVSEMTFGKSRWFGTDGSEVGLAHMLPGIEECAAIRKWLAPHDGTVRIEGKVVPAGKDSTSVHASVLRNDQTIWLVPVVAADKGASHDLKVAVAKGDAICFVVQRPKLGDLPIRDKQVNASGHSQWWDPVVTYVDTSGTNK